MSNDEINLLTMLLRRHGIRAVTAAIALVCTQQARGQSEAGNPRAEEHWKRYADLFQAIAALTPKHDPATE
jgi:hypothetical protein